MPAEIGRIIVTDHFIFSNIKHEGDYTGALQVHQLKGDEIRKKLWHAKDTNVPIINLITSPFNHSTTQELQNRFDWPIGEPIGLSYGYAYLQTDTFFIVEYEMLEGWKFYEVQFSRSVRS